MKNEANDNSFNNLIGAFALGFVSYLTIATRIPSIFSPYSFTVALPALILGPLSFLFIPLFYLGWSNKLYPKPRHRQTGYAIPKRSLILATFMILSSLFWLIAAWGHGVEYQGKNHTLMMYAYNVISWLILFFIYSTNKSKGTFRSSFAFHWMFFAWLPWVSFPWLGELP